MAPQGQKLLGGLLEGRLPWGLGGPTGRACPAAYWRVGVLPVCCTKAMGPLASCGPPKFPLALPMLVWWAHQRQRPLQRAGSWWCELGWLCGYTWRTGQDHEPCKSRVSA